MVGKRHAWGEISAKLAQATELAAEGKTQREISKALGVSIMTYHRWKKLTNATRDSNLHGERREPIPQPATSNDGRAMEIIQRLELENSQLRRLVTDILLDKLKLEGELRSRRGVQVRQLGKRSRRS
jgi:transposase